MKFRIARLAEADIDRAYNYIANERPRAADVVIERILRALRSLPETPMKGRPGRAEGTRELVIRKTGYVAVYAVADNTVTVLRVIHGHQNWPPQEAADEP